MLILFTAGPVGSFAQRWLIPHSQLNKNAPKPNSNLLHSTYRISIPTQEQLKLGLWCLILFVPPNYIEDKRTEFYGFTGNVPWPTRRPLIN